MLAAAAAIRERGDRPVPVPLFTVIALARLAVSSGPASEPGPASTPAAAAGLAIALLDRLNALKPAQALTDQPPAAGASMSS